MRLILRLLLLVLFTSLAGLPRHADAAPTHGAALFAQQCAECHGPHGEGVSAAITIAGPPLLAAHDYGRAMTVMEAGVPGRMPSFVYVLPVNDMRALADYVTRVLAVIPLSGGDLGEGGKLFRVDCAPCHRAAVRGGALEFAATNAPDITDRTPAIIAGAIRQGPGPMPSFPASVISDKQLASIVDYVTFVQFPPSPGGIPLSWNGPVSEGFFAWIAVCALIGITGWIEWGKKG